jgi:hypothetical protein
MICDVEIVIFLPAAVHTAQDLGKEDEDDEDELDDGSFKSAQRKRLKGLASRFHNYDEEDSEAIKAVLAQATATGSPYKRDLTKTVDVDRVINRSSSNDHGFAQSLKAQGFEETTSKSKLVYDFKKKAAGGTPSSREASPYKPDPLQYIRPQQQKTASAASPRNTPTKPNTPKKPAAYRSVSPTRMASPLQRPTSPFKPHPLQFISPQKAIEQQPPLPFAGPPKPARTYMDMEQEEPTDPEPVYLSEVKVHVVQQQHQQNERTDTASRKSILEKRTLFDASPEAVNEAADPAMLPMSQRKALFERNKSVPVPIGRFGESVTPAMLARAHQASSARPGVAIPASEPAWKRKRDKSPEKQSFYTPNPVTRTTPAAIGGRKYGLESKKLFENNWKDNDITRQQEETKKRDMDLLLNRFKQISESEIRRSPVKKSPVKVSSPKRAASPPPKKVSPKKVSPRKCSPEASYPGVNSLKRIKVSPPKEGQMYPNLTEIHDDRPDTAMSGESTTPSEVPSLGKAIKRAASANKKQRHSPMKVISEDTTTASEDDDEEMDLSGDINDMLDEALDDSQIMTEETGDEPTPPKVRKASSPSTSSAASWEFTTPRTTTSQRDFKTPRVDGISDSPQQQLAVVDTEEGPASASNLLHTVSFYRKQKPAASVSVNVTPLGKIVRNAEPMLADQDDRARARADVSSRINKLQEEVEEQMQRRAQASKALGLCEKQDEFEGSYERVEFELVLLEAHHKHAALTAEINRLKNLGARGHFEMPGGQNSSEFPQNCFLKYSQICFADFLLTTFSKKIL